MKQFMVIISVLLLISGVNAQKKSRGVSPMGRIVKPERIKRVSEDDLFDSTDKVKMNCTISFHEPSGDGVLSEGETGSVIVQVENQSQYTAIQPKLEIKLISSWNPKPRSSVKLMEQIEAGRTGRYETEMSWDEQFPAGAVTYEVLAIDTKSGLESEPVEITFHIVGLGREPVEPVFVDVDKAIPRVWVSNSNGIAVVIGNRDYSNPDVPNVDYGIQDARAIKKYLISMMGFREENIIYVENAQKSDFERIFGTETVYEGKLYNYVKPNESDIFIYYSGHGAPKNNEAYLIPSNADPNYIHIDGYQLYLFYKNIDKIPAKSTTIVLDACFSGGSQKGMLLKHASPMYIDVSMPIFGNKFNLFTSASGDQISSWYPEASHSLFTYFFLRAIRGEADENRDRKITLKEMADFLGDHVSYMARRLYGGRKQTPVVRGDLDHVVCSY